MARTKQTARKSTALRPRTIQSKRLETFYSYRMVEGQSISWFLNQFMQRWAAVRGLGVTELDGVLHLVQALPLQWRSWAYEEVLGFIRPDMEYRVTGNLAAFVDHIEERYNPTESPPVCLYTSIEPHEFILVVHQMLEDMLHPSAKSNEPSEVEVPDEESEPEECFNESSVVNQNNNVDRRDNIESSLTSFELDQFAYDQPFSLEPFSPPILPLTPLLEDFPESFLPSIGTSTLQPIPISEMSTDPSTFVSGDPSSSNTDSTPATAEDRAGVSEERNDVEDDDKEGTED